MDTGKINPTDQPFEIESNDAFHEAGLLKLNCDKALFFLQWKPALDFNQTARFTGEWYNYYYNIRKQTVWDYTLNQINEYAAEAQKKINCMGSIEGVLLTPLKIIGGVVVM